MSLKAEFFVVFLATLVFGFVFIDSRETHAMIIIVLVYLSSKLLHLQKQNESLQAQINKITKIIESES